MTEKRQYQRTNFPARVKLMHPDLEVHSFETRDIAQDGIFLLSGQQVRLPVGTQVTVQDDEIMMDPPLVKAKIVRVETDGIALRFIDD